MIPELKSELVTATECEKKYAKLYELTGYKLYEALSEFATEVKEEYQTVLTKLEEQILV